MGTYGKLHLPPRCGDLHILKRILCDGGLSQIVKEVVYHIQPIYTERRLEENIRSVMNLTLPLKKRFSTPKMAKLNADLITNQQQEQAAFFDQLSICEVRNHMMAILRALKDARVRLSVQDNCSLSYHWWSTQRTMMDQHLPRAEHPGSKPFVNLMITIMSPQTVRLDHISSSFFDMDAKLGPEYTSLSCLTVPLSVYWAYSKILELRLDKINLVDVSLAGGLNSAGFQRAIKGFNDFLKAAWNLRSLEIGFENEMSRLSQFSVAYQQVSMLPHGMLKGQKLWALDRISIRGVTSSVEGIVEFITNQPLLGVFSSTSLRVPNEIAALRLLQCLRGKESISFDRCYIDLQLDDGRPLTRGELQSLIKEIKDSQPPLSGLISVSWPPR